MGIYTKIADEGGKWVEIAAEGGAPVAAVINEAASTGCTFYDTTVDGVIYREAEFLNDGTIAFSASGGIHFWLGTAGGNGAGSGAGGIFGSPGRHGGIYQVDNFFVYEDTYEIVVGDPAPPVSNDGKTRINRGGITVVAASGNVWPGSGNAVGWPVDQGVLGKAPTETFRDGISSEHPWGGRSNGTAGWGGNGSGPNGGPPRTITDWGPAPFDWGRGGTSEQQTAASPPNSGKGGNGLQNSSFTYGGSGRAYIRVEI